MTLTIKTYIPTSVIVFNCFNSNINEELSDEYNKTIKNTKFDIEEEISELMLGDESAKYTTSLLDLLTEKEMQPQLLTQIMGFGLLFDLAEVYNDEIKGLKRFFPSGFEFVNNKCCLVFKSVIDEKEYKYTELDRKIMIKKIHSILAREMIDGWGENGSLEMFNVHFSVDRRLTNQGESNLWNCAYNRIVSKQQSKFEHAVVENVKEFSKDNLNEQNIMVEKSMATFHFINIFVNQPFYFKLGLNFSDKVSHYTSKEN